MADATQWLQLSFPERAGADLRSGLGRLSGYHRDSMAKRPARQAFRNHCTTDHHSGRGEGHGWKSGIRQRAVENSCSEARKLSDAPKAHWLTSTTTELSS